MKQFMQDWSSDGTGRETAMTPRAVSVKRTLIMKGYTRLCWTRFRFVVAGFTAGCALFVLAQAPGGGSPGAGDGGFGPGNPPPGADGPDFGGPPPFGPGGPGPGGFGGMSQEKTKLVQKFDKDGDNWLNAAERKAAREYLSKQAANQGRRGPGGGPRGFGRPAQSQTPAQPGLHLTAADVKSFPDAPLYASNVLRTFFLEFEEADWEKELEDFHGTDVEVPARLTVDGKSYSDVGVHFRGASSYMMVGTGQKRSLNLSLDARHVNQRLDGYRTLNLLNSHEDPTFLRTVLCFDIARQYLPAPKANLVRLVINGESWGVYVNAQQFNKDFVKEWFGSKKGARWKVPGSPHGRGSLAYLGQDPAPYKRIYEIKSKDEPRAWTDLINLCKVLNQAPAEKLVEALSPVLDIEGALKFLALENVLINNDGYWVRTSDYDLYEDEKGRFHVIPYDVNETFSTPGGPGFGPGPGGRPGGPGGGRGRRGPGGGGPGGGVQVKGVELDPLIAANDPDKPLISKLLAVPSLRTRYLGYMREMAEKWLDWSNLGPLALRYQALISEDVKADTRKLDSFEAFQQGVSGDTPAQGGGGPGQTISLKSFAEQRRAYLLKHPEIQKAARVP